MIETAIRTLTATAFASSAIAEPAPSSDVSAAAQATEWFYMNQGPYRSPSCKNQNIESRTYMRCTAFMSDDGAGGLYIVEAGPKIFAVNGKAIQHIAKANGSIEGPNGTTIPVARWSGEPIDISKINQAF